MTVHMRMWIAAAMFVLIGCGCSVSPGLIVHLNDPDHSRPTRDVANLFSPREVPYETMEHGGVLVGYNLFFAKNATVSGYRLTLIFKNNSDSRQLIKPSVSLRDDGGVLIRPYSYQAFVARAAILAGTVVPPEPFSCRCVGHYSSGTIDDTAGADSEAGTETGASGPGQVKAMSEDAASGATNDREGLLMLIWANSFWLKESYDLPAGAASWGALFFPTSSLGELPLHLTIELGGRKYEFDTVATSGRG